MKPLKSRPIKDRLCYIEWEDARGVTSEWTDVQELARSTTCVCVSIGVLIAQDRQRVVILPHFMGDDPYGGCGEMVIPRRDGDSAQPDPANVAAQDWAGDAGVDSV